MKYNYLFYGRYLVPGEYVTKPPPQGCSSKIAYKCTANSSFLLGWACGVCVQQCFPFPWLNSHAGYSQIAPLAPSLRILTPSGSVISLKSSKCIILPCMLSAAPSFIWAADNSSTVSCHFPQPSWRHDLLLFDLQFICLPRDPVECPLLPLMWLPPYTSTFYSSVAFLAYLSPHFGCPSIGCSSCKTDLPWSFTITPLAQCRNSMASHLPEGKSQLLPGPTIIFSLLLQPSVAPYG